MCPFKFPTNTKMKKYFLVFTFALALGAMSCKSSESTSTEETTEQDTVRTDVLEKADEMNQDTMNNMQMDTAKGTDTTNMVK